jgi:hypothetical protein
MTTTSTYTEPIEVQVTLESNPSPAQLRAWGALEA